MAEVAFMPISTWDPWFVKAIREHYTESAGAPPGKKQAWRIHEDGIVVGWIGLGEPAYALSPRRRLGIADIRPLPQTVCCFIYRVVVPRSQRVLSSGDLLRLWHGPAAADWSRRYGWEPVHWETMVSQGDAKNLGACFKRAGYRSLGWTTGRGARRPAGHSRGPRVWGDTEKRLVLYRGPLARLP